MRLGIMQPYFFPYLGHFALIAASDHWVVFDVTQYTPRSWMSRNRVLHPQQGWNYINAPLMSSSIKLLTHEVCLQDLRITQMTVLGKLSHYRRTAPYYDDVVALVKRVFDEAENTSLVQVNLSVLLQVCAYLNLPFKYSICSELGLDFGQVSTPGGWAPEICRQLGATAYVNPLSGRELFAPEDFQRSGIELGFLSFSEFVYDTAHYCFEPGLSILDVLMWNSPENILQALAMHSRIISGEST